MEGTKKGETKVLERDKAVGRGTEANSTFNERTNIGVVESGHVVLRAKKSKLLAGVPHESDLRGDQRSAGHRGMSESWRLSSKENSEQNDRVRT